MKSFRTTSWWWWQTRKPLNRWLMISPFSLETILSSSQPGMITTKYLWQCQITFSILMTSLICFWHNVGLLIYFRLQGVLEKLRSVAVGKSLSIEHIHDILHFLTCWRENSFRIFVPNKLMFSSSSCLHWYCRACISQTPAAVWQWFCDGEEPIIC